MNTYNPATQYAATDVVTYQGSSYVALSTSTNVAPIGASLSATNWAVVAQAGATGPTGPAGPQGPTGAAGATGTTGLQGAAGMNMVSFLQGKKLGVQGDSISALFNNAWQNVVTTRTGMTLTVQDAVAGRSFASSLQCWGNPSVGQPIGNYNANYVIAVWGIPCSSTTIGLTDGMTLAQSLANVDIEVIQLGTNDQPLPLGVLGDATNTGTFYGNMRWVAEAYIAAKPTLRLVLVTPQFNGYQSAATTLQYVNAMVAYGSSIGAPVINMYKLGGVNSLTINTLTTGGVHPTPVGFSNFYGPVIAQGLQQIY